VRSLAVSNRGSVAVTGSGDVYWWGLRPWLSRIKALRAREAANTEADFDKAFQQYQETLDDKSSGISTKAEMTAVLASESAFTIRLRRAGTAEEKKKHKHAQARAAKKVPVRGPERELASSRKQSKPLVGERSAEGKALLKLKSIYSRICDGVSVGDRVVVNSSAAQHVYARGAVTLAEDAHGSVSAYRLQNALQSLEGSVEVTPFRRLGNTQPKMPRKMPCKDLLFISNEVSAQQGLVVAKNAAKGVAIVRKVGADTNDDSSVDVRQFSVCSRWSRALSLC
jgi:hypothetical protein